MTLLARGLPSEAARARAARARRAPARRDDCRPAHRRRRRAHRENVRAARARRRRARARSLARRAERGHRGASRCLGRSAVDARDDARAQRARSIRAGRSRPADSSAGSELPRKLAVPDALRRDLRRTLRVVFSRPSRLRRLFALGPRGWAATARFLSAVVPRAGRELALIRERAARIPDPRAARTGAGVDRRQGVPRAGRLHSRDVHARRGRAQLRRDRRRARNDLRLSRQPLRPAPRRVAGGVRDAARLADRRARRPPRADRLLP